MVPIQTASKAALTSLAGGPDSTPQPPRLRAFHPSVEKSSPSGNGGKLSPSSPKALSAVGEPANGQAGAGRTAFCTGSGQLRELTLQVGCPSLAPSGVFPQST